MKNFFLRKGIFYDIFVDDYEIKNRNIEKSELPLNICLQITRKCNLKCIHCSDFQQIKCPNFIIIAKIIDKLWVNGLRRVSISGGEPVLRQDLKKILAYAKKKGFIVTLITNGTLLNEKKVKEIKPFVDNVRISIHGFDSQHDKFTGVKGSFDKSLKGIKLCQKHGIPVSVVSSILLSNVKNLRRLFELICLDLKIRRWRIFTLIARGRARKIFDKEFIHVYDVKEFFNKLKKEKTGISEKIKTKITIKDWRLEGQCLMILPNGALIGVPSFRSKENQYVIGNILKEPLKLMWQKYPFKQNYWQGKLKNSSIW